MLRLCDSRAATGLGNDRAAPETVAGAVKADAEASERVYNVRTEVILTEKQGKLVPTPFTSEGVSRGNALLLLCRGKIVCTRQPTMTSARG